MPTAPRPLPVSARSICFKQTRSYKIFDDLRRIEVDGEGVEIAIIVRKNSEVGQRPSSAPTLGTGQDLAGVGLVSCGASSEPGFGSPEAGGNGSGASANCASGCVRSGPIGSLRSWLCWPGTCWTTWTWSAKSGTWKSTRLSGTWLTPTSAVAGYRWGAEPLKALSDASRTCVSKGKRCYGCRRTRKRCWSCVLRH